MENMITPKEEGGWGLGIGVGGLGIGPYPQSPIPNPHKTVYTIKVLLKEK